MANGSQPWRANYSNISTYEQCPYKFRLLVVDGRKDLRQRSSAALALGISVHTALHETFLLPASDRVEQRMLEKLRDAFLKNFRGIERDETQAMWTRGKRAIRLFLAHEDLSVEPLFLEEFLYADLPGFTVSGKIDRAHRDPDGIPHVVDYKTGDTLHSQIQSAIYSILASDRLAEDRLRVSFLYVERESDRWMTYEVDEPLIEKAIADVSQIVERIRADSALEPRPNPLCEWCQCLPVCDAGKAYIGSAPKAEDFALD